MSFLRTFSHLLPRSPTWSLTFNKTLKKFFAGLAAPLDDPDPSKSPRAFADAIFSDAFPSTTRQLGKWRYQFGVERGANDAADVLQLTSAWQAQGGQSPKYLQDTLQAAGFPLYVHEWWKEGVAPFAQVCAGDTLAQAGEPSAQASSRSYKRFVRDPRNYTTQPITGSTQASALADQPQCSAFVDQPQANAFLVNNPGYLVNLDLSPSAPPAIPDDTLWFAGRDPKPGQPVPDWSPHAWPYFFYLGGATFADRVSIPASRRAELERLVLKLRPTHLWVVMLVDYVDSSGAPDHAITLTDGSYTTLTDGSYATTA